MGVELRECDIMLAGIGDVAHLVIRTRRDRIMFVFGPVCNHMCDAIPENCFNEVKIVSKFVFEFLKRLDSRFRNQSLKPLL
jgi:hypothetical protein